MERLRVKADKIIDSSSKPVRLRGTCVGGWMNMENFINGYPGDESGTRRAMAQTIRPAKAEFFFDRLLDYFFNEDDIRFIKECGANVVRLPVNYRHFESDAAPFQYLEKGFARLDRVIEWCNKHNLYVIIDLHAVQGWQNTDWHCDNPSRQTLFWTHRQFQDRFVALWEEFARRYVNNPTVAGYNVMNEPVTNAPFGRFSNSYTPDWEIINQVYRRVVAAIRAIDPNTIIFLEGDYFSSLFAGLEPPFAENLVYSSHNYTSSGFGPGSYPGTIQGVCCDRASQEADFLKHEGTRFTQANHVPLWVGEFGSVYNGPAHEHKDRLQALDDQLAVFGKHQAHWTTWTYKDVGVMGWVMLPRESPYLRTIQPALQAKYDLYSDFWMQWLPLTPVAQDMEKLADKIANSVTNLNIDRAANRTYLMQQTLSGYVGNLLQPCFALCFQNMTENEIDLVLQSFALKNCAPNAELISVIKKHLNF
jgi:aryl-phospho-beta-D-glucosidase BglC (GH1 family)